MAKYQRYRRYSRRRFGKHWSTRLTSINVTQLVNANQQFFIYRTLATNPAQDDNTVSQRFTVKNVNVQVNIENASSADPTGNPEVVENLQHYILYIPQGYTLTADTPFEHPEWIMSYRFIGSPVSDSNPGYAPLRISTRLSRKLDTGDRIVYLLIGTNTSNLGTATIYVSGLVKLNTKAN